MFTTNAIKGALTDVAASAQNPLGTLYTTDNETYGTRTYKYVKATADIDAGEIAATDVSEQDNFSVELGGANAYGVGVATGAMTSATNPYGWIQVGGYVSGLASMTAAQHVASAASGAVTSNAAPSAADLGNSIAISSTEAVLKGLI